MHRSLLRMTYFLPIKVLFFPIVMTFLFALSFGVWVVEIVNGELLF